MVRRLDVRPLNDNHNTRWTLCPADPEDDIVLLTLAEREEGIAEIQREHGLELQGVIGEGGLGAVYKAKRQGRVYAVKISKSVRADLEREAVIMRRVNEFGAKAPEVFAAGEKKGLQYIVMEHIAGPMLNRGRKLHPMYVASIGNHLAESLDACHRAGVVHHDVKPANVIQGKKQARLLDYGLAEYVNENDPLLEGGGTPTFMAPEKYCGETTNTRSDLFGLGATLYVLLTGQTITKVNAQNRAALFASMRTFYDTIHQRSYTPPSELVQQENKPSAKILEPIIGKLLAYDPKDRYASSAEVAKELDSAILRMV